LPNILNMKDFDLRKYLAENKLLKEEHPDHTHGLTIKGRGFDWKKEDKQAAYTLHRLANNVGSGTAEEFLKNNPNIDLKSLAKAIQQGTINKYELRDIVKGVTQPSQKFMEKFVKKSVNENEIPHQEEVDKFFSDTQNEMHYLNQKPVAGQKRSRTHTEIEPWDGYDLSNWNALVRKAKKTGKIKDVDEGTCGYGKNGKLGKKPAGPHLITKADLKEKIVNIIKKYQ